MQSTSSTTPEGGTLYDFLDSQATALEVSPLNRGDPDGGEKHPTLVPKDIDRRTWPLEEVSARSGYLPGGIIARVSPGTVPDTEAARKARRLNDLEELLEGTRFANPAEISSGGINTIYRVEQDLGEGPWPEEFGLVLPRKYFILRARSQRKDDTATVKYETELSERTSLSAERMFNEFTILNRLSHPGIPRPYAFLVDPTNPSNFAEVLEYINGQTLTGIVVDVPVAITIGKQVVDVLRYSHGRGIIHRDIKPENLIFCEDTERIKVIDWDGAKDIVWDETFGEDEEDDYPVSVTPDYSFDVIGTPMYAPPEVLLYNDPVPLDQTPAIDVWGLAATLQKLAYGSTIYDTRGFTGGDVAKLKKAVRRDRRNKIPLPTTEQEEMFQYVLELATQAKPEDRINSKEFKNYLDELSLYRSRI